MLSLKRDNIASECPDIPTGTAPPQSGVSSPYSPPNEIFVEYNWISAGIVNKTYKLCRFICKNEGNAYFEAVTEARHAETRGCLTCEVEVLTGIYGGLA